MRRALTLTFPALLLAACSASGDSDSGGTAVSADPELTAPSAAKPAAGDQSASLSPASVTIPPAMQGRWGLVPADCTSTRGDAKGLLEIGPRSIKFYESLATLQGVQSRSDDALRAAFGFSGEGMTWQRDMLLEVSDGGKTLTRREFGTEAVSGSFKYTRC